MRSVLLFCLVLGSCSAGVGDAQSVQRRHPVRDIRYKVTELGAPAARESEAVLRR